MFRDKYSHTRVPWCCGCVKKYLNLHCLISEPWLCRVAGSARAVRTSGETRVDAPVDAGMGDIGVVVDRVGSDDSAGELEAVDVGGNVVESGGYSGGEGPVPCNVAMKRPLGAKWVTVSKKRRCYGPLPAGENRIQSKFSLCWD